MFTRPAFCAAVVLILSLSSCSSEKTASTKTHLGGCILISPAAHVPSDVYQETDVMATDDYKPFTKKLSVYGHILIGRDDISDDFMRKVAKTVKEIFPKGEGIDAASAP